MGVGELLAVLALALAIRRPVGRPVAYGLLLAGIVLALVTRPIARPLVFLCLAGIGAWVLSRGDRRTRALAITAGGLGLYLLGGVVDAAWHTVNPSAIETNVLALPGHQIELLGWIVGLAGTLAALVMGRVGRRGAARGQPRRAE